MALITTVPTISRVECDKPSCVVTITPPVLHWREWEGAVRDWLRQEGWSVWVGRSRRYYCPQHGPNNLSKMRRVI